MKGSFTGGIVAHKKTYKDAGSAHFDWEAEEGTFDTTAEMPVAVPKGATLCWHGAALHGSHANASARWRRAWAVHFVAEGSTMQAGGDADELAIRIAK